MTPKDETNFPPHRHPKVLYIGGCGRSGSTLLDRMLGQVPGFFSAGELVHLWRRCVLADEPCGCGESFSECPLWTSVGHMAFRDWRGFDIADVLSLQSRVDRNRFIPFLLQPSLSASYRAHLRRYAELVSHLYTAIANAAGADVVVDSSKHPSTAFLLRHVGVDLRVVHLVRDAHGVAFSWAKKVYRPEATPGHELMATATPVRSASRWMTYNLLFHLLASTGTPVLLVRYETLVRSPRQELSRILALVDVRPPDHVMQFVRPGAVSLRPNHTVSGNPLRFLQGSVALRPDDAWKERMRWEQRAVTTALTWPLLARYGYRQWRTADGG